MLRYGVGTGARHAGKMPKRIVIRYEPVADTSIGEAACFGDSPLPVGGGAGVPRG